MKRRRRIICTVGCAMIACILGGALVPLIREWRLRQRRRRLLPLIRDVADRHRLDPNLVLAVIHQESRFCSDARGKAGEMGLMQVTPRVARDWERLHHRRLQRDTLLFDPRTNVEIGVWYLARADRQFSHHPQRRILALCQYNAGRSRALEWEAKYKENLIDRIPIASTRHYIRNVMELRAAYARNSQPKAP